MHIIQTLHEVISCKKECGSGYTKQVRLLTSVELGTRDEDIWNENRS